jgi:quercetin dioxygenase-like cupin family protein
MQDPPATNSVLAEVGPRLKRVRAHPKMTLTQLAADSRKGRIVVPLTNQANGRHALKVLIPPEPGEPEMRVHEGNEWLYVLSGKLRLILGGRDITINAGEVAEFKTRIRHWFGSADDQPVEILSLLSGHGEHLHVRAATTSQDQKD